MVQIHFSLRIRRQDHQHTNVGKDEAFMPGEWTWVLGLSFWFLEFSFLSVLQGSESPLPNPVFKTLNTEHQTLSKMPPGHCRALDPA
jgi:hypothetical protein